MCRGRRIKMTRKIRFLHTADLHLGSLLHTTGDLSDEIKVKITRATYDAFQKICDSAIKYSVDFLLIAGDLYDREARSVEANRFFVEQCCRLQEENIPIFVIAGNHDPLIKQIEAFNLPENVFVFSSATAEMKKILNQEGELIARVFGQSYRRRSDSRKMYESYLPMDKDVWNIGLLHTQLEADNNNYVPCSVTDLASIDGIHYWALGHIHRCRVLKESEPTIVFPGIPQGRDFGETGVGGCLLVEMIPDQNPVIKFISVSSIIWKRMEISIATEPDIEGSDVKNLEDLEEKIIKKAEELLPEYPTNLSTVQDELNDSINGYAIQWVITGRGELHNLLIEHEEEAVRVLTDSLRKKLADRLPFIWTDSIMIRTGKPLPHLELLKQGNSLFLEMDSVVQEYLTEPDLRKELLNAMGQIWEWQSDHEQIDELKFQLDENHMVDILEQAQRLIIERMVDWGQDI